MSHLKRLAAPKAAHIRRKANKFLIKPSPGTHSKDKSVALLVFMRDILKSIENKKQGMHIISGRVVLVDGVVRKNKKFPVGFMDVVTVGKENYRLTFDKKGRLVPIKLKGKETNLKIGRITRKTMVKGGKLQITLHDGRNIIIPKSHAKKYVNGASVLINVPEQNIVKYIPYDKDSEVFLISGKHIGETAKIVGISGEKVVLKGEDGNQYETLGNYAFPISKEVSVK